MRFPAYIILISIYLLFVLFQSILQFFEFKFFGLRTDQCLFYSPSYFNSEMLKPFNKEKVNKKSMCKYLTSEVM